jgi:hypothetical protein
MFWIFKKNVIKKLNYTSDNDSYWLKQLILLFMINEHIISIEFSSNSFNATYDFNTKACFLKREVFMNWNVQDEWYNGKKNTR